MHAPTDAVRCKSHDHFMLRFKKRMCQMLAEYDSPAEAFGPAWEATLDEVPVPDVEQGKIYWQLIDWARSGELFTSTRAGIAYHDAVAVH